MSVVCKKGVGKASREPTLERAWFIASTSGVDRYGDVVDQTSWLLDEYKANPVIQVDHDWRAEKNVGRAASIGVENGQLVVEIEWGTSDLAKDVAQKVVAGHLGAVSVGLKSATVTYRDALPKTHEHYGQRGYLYQENTLVEISVVVVPANAEAVTIRRALSETAPDLADSEYSQPPIGYARTIRDDYPEIWAAGGETRGNEAFELWSRFRAGDRADEVLAWVSEREAWAARHFGNGDAFVGDSAEVPTLSNIGGVVAWLKWGVIGQLGWPKMRELLDTLKGEDDAEQKKSVAPETPVTEDTDGLDPFLRGLLIAPDPFDHLYFKGE